jgi:hypothetical protein
MDSDSAHNLPPIYTSRRSLSLCHDKRVRAWLFWTPSFLVSCHKKPITDPRRSSGNNLSIYATIMLVCPLHIRQHDSTTAASTKWCATVLYILSRCKRLPFLLLQVCNWTLLAIATTTYVQVLSAGAQCRKNTQQNRRCARFLPSTTATCTSLYLYTYTSSSDLALASLFINLYITATSKAKLF